MENIKDDGRKNMPHCNKRMISFFVTTKCNLCCRYCYNAQERNAIKEHTISLDFAKAGIEWYFANNESRHIRFYGPGEPTQEFEIMKQITEYAKFHSNGGDRVTVELQTNGVFTDIVRDWILDNINIIWISFDGMKDIQNYNRPLNPQYSKIYSGKTAADVLEDNIRWLIDKKESRNLMVGARTTITNENADKQIEMVDYFYNLGIRYVWTDPLFYSVGKIPVCEDLDKRKSFHFDMDLYLDNYIKAYHYAKDKDMFWGSFLAVNFDGESFYHCRCCTPLDAPHLTPDGYVSSCDMVVLGKDTYHMSPFIIGKWNAQTKKFNFDLEKICDLNNRCSSKIEHCQNCPVQFHCGGYCLGEIVNETGKLVGQNQLKCKAVIKLFKELGVCDTYEFFHP